MLISSQTQLQFTLYFFCSLHFLESNTLVSVTKSFCDVTTKPGPFRLSDTHLVYVSFQSVHFLHLVINRGVNCFLFFGNLYQFGKVSAFVFFVFSKLDFGAPRSQRDKSTPFLLLFLYVYIFSFQRIQQHNSLINRINQQMLVSARPSPHFNSFRCCIADK